MAVPLLELAGVHKRFDGGRITAADGVDLSVAAKEAVAIVGPSGSGKTTLMNLATGLDLPDAGSVQFEGEAVGSAGRWTLLRRSRIGIVFQAFHLIGALTARENVEMPLVGAGLPARQRRSRALASLDRVNLGHRADHLPATLSGGERQRVAIARAIATEPSLLVADEPTGSLDSAASEHVVDLLLDLVRTSGAALLVVTHDAGVAERMDRVVRLVDGRVVGSETAAA
ncbi:MAG: ABC transporter ATP-binding protein [Rhodospirillaceae bacterium]|nr:ABC transporter ATP-binding protein [Rhodospirillaceae bacterium]